MLKLYKEARFDALVKGRDSSEMADKFYSITSRWSNTHRFASRAKLVSYLNEIRATHNVRGDKLKANRSEMFSAAEFIVKIGLEKWTN